jgi:hypothetical protein
MTSPQASQFVLPASWALAAMAGGAALLALAHGGVRVCWEVADCGPLERPVSRHGWLFDLGAEMNVPSWYSSSQLLIAAGLLAVIALGARHAAPGSSSRRNGGEPDGGSLPWVALSLIFVYLSLDEISDLHGLWRQFTLPDSYRLPGTTDPNYAWVVPGLVLVVALAIAFRRFVLELPARTRRLIVLAGAIYIGGAIGAELVGGLIVNATWNNTAFLIVSALEEVGEMLGIALFIYALLLHLGGHLIRIQLGPAE